MNKKIMVVEDEPDIVKVIKIILESENHSVIETNSGEECLAKLELSENPTLILLDIMLPGINGYDLFKKLKQNEKFKNIKIAFMSAHAQTSDINNGLSLGVDDYITKPFDPFDFIIRVNNIIKKQ